MPIVSPYELDVSSASALDYFEASRAADAHLAARGAFRFGMATGPILLDSPADAEDLAILEGRRLIEVKVTAPTTALIHAGWMEAGGAAPTWPNGLFVVKAAGGDVWTPHRKESGIDTAGASTATVEEPGPVYITVGIGRKNGQEFGWVRVNGKILMSINDLAIGARVLPRIYASTGSGNVDFMAYKRDSYE